MATSSASPCRADQRASQGIRRSPSRRPRTARPPCATSAARPRRPSTSPPGDGEMGEDEGDVCSRSSTRSPSRSPTSLTRCSRPSRRRLRRSDLHDLMLNRTRHVTIASSVGGRWKAESSWHHRLRRRLNITEHNDQLHAEAEEALANITRRPGATCRRRSRPARCSSSSYWRAALIRIDVRAADRRVHGACAVEPVSISRHGRSAYPGRRAGGCVRRPSCSAPITARTISARWRC